MSSSVLFRQELSSSSTYGRTQEVIVEAIRNLAMALLSLTTPLSARSSFVRTLLDDLSSADLAPYASLVDSLRDESSQMTRQQYYKAILKRILQTPGPITSNPELLTYVPFLRNLVRPFDIKQSDEFVLSAGRALLDANQTVGGVAKS